MSDPQTLNLTSLRETLSGINPAESQELEVSENSLQPSEIVPHKSLNLLQKKKTKSLVSISKRRRIN